MYSPDGDTLAKFLSRLDYPSGRSRFLQNCLLKHLFFDLHQKNMLTPSKVEVIGSDSCQSNPKH